MIALDTNVLVDLEEGPPAVAERAYRAIEGAGDGALVICGAVYAELCAGPRRSAGEVSDGLRLASIAIATLDLDVWRMAGIAFAEYASRRRKAGGEAPRRVLTDFVIGAHAATLGTLVTSDAEFFRRAFPALRVIDPREERA